MKYQKKKKMPTGSLRNTALEYTSQSRIAESWVHTASNLQHIAKLPSRVILPFTPSSAVFEFQFLCCYVEFLFLHILFNPWSFQT